MEYSEEQKNIILDKSKFMQVIAAAGSGKTSTMIGLLEKIILDKIEKQEEILVITFTRKATGELQERLNKKVGENKVRIQTFHAYCLYILQKYKPEFINTRAEIIDEFEKKKIFKEYFVKEKFKIGGIPYDLILSTNDSFLKSHFPDLFLEVNQIYQTYKKTKNKLDFDDLIQIYLSALEENLSWAIEARSEVKRVIVDEFQDTDFNQLRWLQLLQPEKLCVVGDDWQAIYGFRGATTEPFLKFQSFFTPCKVHFLTSNYRSLKEIIQISSIPISKNKLNIKKKVKPVRTGKAKISRFTMESEEDLFYFKDLILESKEEVMILCRSNYRIAYFKKIGIPEANLITIHSSKGLEFDSVVVDLISGWNLSTNETRDVLEEERRILYVALSRAKNQLMILGSAKKEDKKIESEFFSYFKFKVKKFAA
jgi:DNA helicase II / ATP-dependent DNA helicase PcrA